MSSCTMKNAPGTTESTTMDNQTAVTGTAAVSSAANAGVAVASCSTHSVAAAAAVVAAADVTSWCKRKRYSSGPEDAHDSYTHPSAPKQGRHAAQQHQQQQQSATATGRNVYIKLADESPPRSDADSDVDSVYGSFHGLETDICRDTSDTDSYSTEEFATLDVLEYEIPSDSSTSEELYSHDSSSGTDDFVVTAAQLARAIFACQQTSTEIGMAEIEVSEGGGGGVGGDNANASGVMRKKDGSIVIVEGGNHGGVGSGSDNGSRVQSSTDFEVFADTEESDAPTDPELGLADYWTCVKCKNRQNNPMYRYCERCYQIRKTHFPPRPKLQKTRSSIAALGGGHMQRSVDSLAAQQRHQRPNSDRNRRRRHDDGGTSNGDDDDDDDDDDETDGDIDSGRNRLRRRRRRTHSGPHNTIGDYSQPIDATASASTSLSQPLPATGGATIQYKHLPSLHPPKRRRRSSTECNSDASSNADMFRSNSMATVNSASMTQSSHSSSIVPTYAAASAATIRTAPTHLQLHTSTRDSGFQSSSASATDQTPELERDLLPLTQATAAIATASQETYCSDLELQQLEQRPDQTAHSSRSATQTQDDEEEAALGHGSAVMVTASSSTLSTGSSLDLPITRSTSSCSLHFDSLVASQDDCDETTDATLNGTVLQVSAAAAGSTSSIAGTSFAVANNRRQCANDEVRTIETTGAAAAAVSVVGGTQTAAADAADVANGMCMMCLTQPKNGVFVHSRFLHLCCCYRCAVKVWNKQKRCPICNCKVKNVMKLFVH